MLSGARARLACDPALAARVTLIEGEAERLPFAEGEFDHLTFTYLLRYVEDPAATLAEAGAGGAPGRAHRLAGVRGAPQPAWRASWRLYTHLGLPALGRLFSREWFATGRFLARSIPEFYERYPLERIVELWRVAGIEGVQVRRMSLGGGVVMWGTRSAPGER